MLFSYIFILYRINVELAPSCGISCKKVNNLSDYKSWREQRIIQQLLKSYNRLTRPSPPDFDQDLEDAPPVIITTSIDLHSISTVTEQNMEFKAQFRFEQEWTDPRLRFRDTFINASQHIRLAKDQIDQVWLPDTFFQNEKSGHYHLLDQPNLFFLLRSDGNIIYNRRLTMTFSCVMDFFNYPMDVQNCEIDFASYAYTTADIVYLWKDKPVHLDPMAKKSLPNFFIRSFINSSCSSVTNTGEYSCLRVILSLQRDFSFFLLQVYLPSTMLVSVAWISYWIDWQATAARFPLIILTLLAMITRSHVINANLPPVSYAKAIDVWIGACVMFILSALIEYAFVNYSGIKFMKTRPQFYNDPGLPPPTSNMFRNALDKLALWGRSRSRRLVEHLLETDTLLAATIRTSRSKSYSTFCNFRFGRRRCQIDYRLDDAQLIDDTERSPFDYTLRLFSCQRPNSFSNCDQTELDYVERRCRRFRINVWNCYKKLTEINRAERIDVIFRVVFPLAFALFNIVYWWVYW